MRFVRNNWLLILIFLLAAFLRFYKLSTIPIGFNDDEAAFGYNAYSILKTARDEWGRFLPFPVFESFGDWKLVVYLYLTVISVFIFGLNEFATRFPSALIGTLAIFATYLLAKKLFDKKVALAASLLLAISPWHIIASRNAFESDLLTFFLTMGTYYLVLSFKDKRIYFFSILFFVVSFYTYRSSWLFVPLFLTFVAILYRHSLKGFKKVIIKNLLIASFLLIPLLPVGLTFQGQSRFLQESIITGIQRIGIANEVNNRRGICNQTSPNTICLIIYNKYTFFISSYLNNYFNNLSYRAFFENANPTGFQSFMSRSLFYVVELPLLIFGFILLFKNRQPAAKILIPWVLLSPVGASIAGTANFGRMNLLMPSLEIVAAYGLVSIFRLVAVKRLSFTLKLVTSIIISFSLIKLLVDMFLVDPFYTSRYQRYGYKQLFSFLESQQNSFDEVYISKQIDNSHQYIQYLFFQKIEPQIFFDNVKRDRGDNGWVSVSQVLNYHFVPSIPKFEAIELRALLVIAHKETTFGVKPLYVIKFINSDPGFEVYNIEEIKLQMSKAVIK